MQDEWTDELSSIFLSQQADWHQVFESSNYITYSLYFPSEKYSLATLTTKLHAQIEAFTKEHLWHKDPFQVSNVENNSLDDYIVFSGKTRFGDCIDDEWLITALLFQLSEELEDVVIELEDDDGQYLLIEAAVIELPEWCSPEYTSSRVFVHQGQIHLVSPAMLPVADKLKALELVRDQAMATLADAKIQQVVRKRIAAYPERSNELRHSVRVLLPREAAVVLKYNPAFIAKAVEAFYYREPKLTSKIGAKMEKFVPDRQKPFVQYMLHMTRHLFAQVKQQEFYPPKPFVEHVPKDTPAGEPEHEDFQAATLGMKICVGLELLCHKSSLESEIVDAILREHPVDKEIFSDAEIGADDDDSWMYIHPSSLEEMLNKTATELDERDELSDSEEENENEEPKVPTELLSMVNMTKDFVDKVSGLEGVDPMESNFSEPVSCDMDALLQLLQGVNLNEMGTMGDDEDSAEEELATYMNEMEAELSETKMGQSFAPVETPATDEKSIPEQETRTDEPVDVDFNLVSNFLESIASQEGRPGPVSNMLNEIGFVKSLSEAYPGK